MDIDIQHLTYVLERAAKHKGTALVEVYQDCNVFNSGAFEYAQDRNVKADNIVYLEHGKPLIYGKDKKKGIRLDRQTMKPEIVDTTKVAPDDLLFHDEKAEEPTLAFLLARMVRPEFPEPVGVLRAIERPTYDEQSNKQIKDSIAKFGAGDLDKLFNSGDTWTVE